MELNLTRYDGRADNAWPPFESGWAEVAADDESARGKALELGRMGLPPYHYLDHLLRTGLYRFFGYEGADGQTKISALKFVGQDMAEALLARPAPRMGDLSAFQRAASDLDAQVATVVTAGDTYLNNGESDNALTAYKAAGQTAVTTLGPEIDNAGAASVTQSLTQFAWGLNGQLAAATDATAAQGLAHNILQTLRDAIAAGEDSLNTPVLNSGDGTPLLVAAQALETWLQQSGVPPSSEAYTPTRTFQQAYVDAGNTLKYGVDGKYGPETAGALARVLGHSVPAPNSAPSSGTTTTEPVPSGGACTSWQADSSAAAMTIANAISYGTSSAPAKWKDQSTYDTTISGRPTRFVMWYENGHRMVAAYSCAGGGAAPSGGVSTAGVVAGVGVVGALATVAAIVIAKSSGKLGAMYPGRA